MLRCARGPCKVAVATTGAPKARLVIRASPVGHRTPGRTSGTCRHSASSSGPAAEWMAMQCTLFVRQYKSPSNSHRRAERKWRRIPPSTPPPPNIRSLAARVVHKRE